MNSPAYLSLKSSPRPQKWSTGAVQVKSAITDDDGAAVLAEGDDSAGDYTSGLGGAVTQPYVRPEVFLPGLQAPTVRALMSQAPTTSNPVRVLLLKEDTNAAAGVHEGANKPGESLDAVRLGRRAGHQGGHVCSPPATSGSTTSNSSWNVLNTRLAQYVRIETDDQLINGAGGNDLTGILGEDAPDLDAALYTNVFDAIAHAITAVRTGSQMEPDSVVLHPDDAVDLLTAKSTLDGNYYSGGPYSPVNVGPFGLRQVVTTAIAPGFTDRRCVQDGRHRVPADAADR